MKKLLSLPILLLLITIGCQPSKQKEQASETPYVPHLTKLWETDTLLTTSESVIYDAFRDVLYVSNINNVPPTAKDEDGFISIMSTSGEIIDLKWVTNISAPKGMGIVDSNLYVTNIDEVVEIDIPSGTITKRYPIDDAQFLNDITVAPDGTLLISDSNLNNIHKLYNEKTSTWLSDSTLNGINGLLYQNDNLLVASFDGGEFYRLKTNPKTKEVLSDSIKGGDGIVALDQGYIISSWYGEIHYVDNDGIRTLLMNSRDEGKNAADIWYIPSKQLLLVPTFFGNTVAAYQVE